MFQIICSGPQSPCRQDCQDRTATCHGRCEAYLRYEKEREAYRNQQHENNGCYFASYSAKLNALDRRAKEKRKGQYHSKPNWNT